MSTRIQIIKRYFRSLFDLKGSQEDELETDREVREGVVFKGKNLWLLAFAIFISCIGLNINSKAAVIGAMIISPLMGPIFGIGFSLGVSDLDLITVLNDSDESKWQSFIVERKISNWLNLKSNDPKRAYQNEFNAYSNPNFFLINKKGTVVLKSFNPMAIEELVKTD